MGKKKYPTTFEKRNFNVKAKQSRKKNGRKKEGKKEHKRKQHNYKYLLKFFFFGKVDCFKHCFKYQLTLKKGKKKNFLHQKKKLSVT